MESTLPTFSYFDSQLAGYQDHDATAFAVYAAKRRKILDGALAVAHQEALELHALGVRCGPEFDDFDDLAGMLDLARDKPKGCLNTDEVFADDKEQFVEQERAQYR